MKKLLATLFAAVFLLSAFSSANAQFLPAPPIAARSWLLLDASSGQIIASRDAETRIEPASLTKLMTAYLTFSALNDKRIDLNQAVNVSTRAWKVDPTSSKMFIEPRTPVTVEDLLYGLIVQSGNDAAVALAEAVAGDEDSFVIMMNKEAERMGMKSTSFANSHGLPHKDNYSTAFDLSILAANLIRDYPQLYKMYSTKEFTYNRIRQQNRNRLLWVDPTVDGLKTGHTEGGGYSLIATAKRSSAAGERRMLTVVIGTSSDQMRAQESLKLLNWGFQNFDTVKLYDKGQVIATPDVWKGSQSQVPIGFSRDAYVTVPKGMAARMKTVLERKDPLIAPFSENSQVGVLKILVDEKLVAELPVVALEQVNPASFLGRLWDTIRLWFK
jgi:D-alanyl-D-alanine carboxypeptidase (penicillin-binding protein 5/6)